MNEPPKSERLARKVKLVWRMIWRRAPLSTVLFVYYAASQIPEHALLVAFFVMLFIEDKLDGKPFLSDW